MPNSNVVNLYPVPNDQATVKQKSIAILASALYRSRRRIRVIRLRILVGMIYAVFGICAQSLAFDEPAEMVSIHGFVSQGFLLSDTNDIYAGTQKGTFQFNEFGLTFFAQISERLHAGIQVLRHRPNQFRRPGSDHGRHHPQYWVAVAIHRPGDSHHLQ